MTRRLLAATALVIIALLLAPRPALARGRSSSAWGWFGGWWHNHDDRHGTDDGSNPRSVPEFDPAAVGAVVAVLTGGALVLARRRKQ